MKKTQVLCPRKPVLICYHCVNIFTRDYVGLGSWNYLVFLRLSTSSLLYFFPPVYLSIASAGKKKKKHKLDGKNQVGWWYRPHRAQKTKLLYSSSAATLRAGCTSWPGLDGKLFGAFVCRETWENQVWSDAWSPTGPAFLSMMEEPKNKTEATSVNTGISSLSWYR